MRPLCILLLCVRVMAQDSFADQLMKAPDAETAARLAAENPAGVSAGVFEAIRKAGQTHLDHRENPEALRDFLIAYAVAKALHADLSEAVSLRGAGIAY